MAFVYNVRIANINSIDISVKYLHHLESVDILIVYQYIKYYNLLISVNICITCLCNCDRTNCYVECC